MKKTKILVALTTIAVSAVAAFGLTACKINMGHSDNNYSNTSGYDNVKEQTFTYSLLNDGTYSVCLGQASQIGDVVVPTSYLGRSVTVIKKGGFSESSIKSIKIPKSITVIEDSAFARCKSLVKVEMTNGLLTIGKSAFSECVSLNDLKLPESLQTIGLGAFFKCEKLTSVEIPNNVSNIYSSAFENCRELQNIKLSNKLTIINNSTFANCIKLKSIEIPDCVVTIGSRAFV